MSFPKSLLGYVLSYSCHFNGSLYITLLPAFVDRKKLARRLLFDKSANDEHERSILTKLKQQCGGQFTSKMEGMVSFHIITYVELYPFCNVILICFHRLQLFQVTDLTLARENQASFEEYLSNNSNANPGIDLTVTVLTTGFWPSYKSFDLNLPAEMVMQLTLNLMCCRDHIAAVGFISYFYQLLLIVIWNFSTRSSV